MDKLQSLLKNIEQQFGYNLSLTQEDKINAKECSIDSLKASRGLIQEQIDRTIHFGFSCLKSQIAIVEPLIRMQHEIDKEIASLQALSGSQQDCIKKV